MEKEYHKLHLKELLINNIDKLSLDKKEELLKALYLIKKDGTGERHF